MPVHKTSPAGDGDVNDLRLRLLPVLLLSLLFYIFVLVLQVSDGEHAPKCLEGRVKELRNKAKVCAIAE